MKTVPIVISIVALVLCSAFFSASETAFSSLNRIRLKNLAERGNRRAARAVTLLERYDELLSTVLVGNNIVNILTSSLATVLFVGYFGNYGVTVSTIVTTIVVLIFGEITPKALAKESAESFAMFATPALKVLTVVLTPLNKFFTLVKRLSLKLFRVNNDTSITEQELLTFVGEAREEGGINESEESMIRSAIEFDDLQAVEICTPRVDIYAVRLNDSPDIINATFRDTGFSRLPVFEGTIDNIIGIVLEKDFYYYVRELGQELSTIVRPTLFVTKTIKISKLLAELQQSKIQMATIVDEYGGTLGIVTVEDILEELVGEIWDEHDDIVEDIRQLDDGCYYISGGTDIDDMMALFGLHVESSALTVGGWVIETLGAIPKAGDSFLFEGLRITVERMLRNRVDAVTVQPESPAE